jgi:hypothetical protein
MSSIRQAAAGDVSSEVGFSAEEIGSAHASPRPARRLRAAALLLCLPPLSLGCTGGTDTPTGDGEDEPVAEASQPLSRSGPGAHVALSVAGGDFQRPARWSGDFSMDTGWDPLQNPRALADVDGDHRMDVVGFSNDGVKVARSTGSGFTATSLWAADFGWSAGGWDSTRHPRFVADVNGDGKQDIVGFGSWDVRVALSDGTKFLPTSTWSSDFCEDDDWWVSRHVRQLADMNGDGKADVVGFGKSGVKVALSTGSSFGPTQAWSGDFGEDYNWNQKDYPRYLADVNGDGKLDVVGFGQWDVWVALSDGTKLGPTQSWSQEFSAGTGWTSDRHVRLLADVDGDGRADVVGFGDYGVRVALSTGTGFAPSAQWIGDFSYVTDGWRVDKHPRMLVDMNNDGKADIVGFGHAGAVVALSAGNRFKPAVLWAEEYGYNPGFAVGWHSQAEHPRFVGDVDGDGLKDLVGLGTVDWYWSRRFDETTWLTAHNAFTNADGGWLLHNQTQGIQAQLQAGVRGLMLDVWHHDYSEPICYLSFGADCDSSGLYLCHEGCEGVIGGNYVVPRKTLAAALTTVRDFLNQNPNEIVTVFLEDYAWGPELYSAIGSVPGLTDMVFNPMVPDWNVPFNGWPTLRRMVMNHKRLLLITDEETHDGLQGMMYGKSYTVENTYDIGLGGSDYTCTSRWGDIALNRTEPRFNRLFVMNHFRKVPMDPSALVDNTYWNLRSRVYDYCLPAAGKLPNYVALDFTTSSGASPMQLVSELNAAR